MHLLDPVAKAVHDHAADNRMIGVERVPRAAVVGIAGAVRLQNVVGAVVDSAEAQRGAAMVAFRRVIEHHVENDFDPARCSALTMSRNSSTAPSGSLARAVRLVRRKERDGRIAPVIDMSRRAILSIELEDRQKFYGGDAEILEIRDLFDQPGVCAALLFGNPELGWRVKPRTCIS